MSVVVTKSSPVVVRPSEPAGSSHVNLSSVDECHACLPVTALLAFDNPIPDPVETIKRALSEALVHYRPIAGRLADDEGGALRIACTGEGVSFVGASASCALLPTTLQNQDVAPQYPADLCRHSDPLLLMQVTAFSCGGFTVAVTWNHAVADGVGMAQFLQAVGELARGKPAPSVLPVRSCEEAGSLLAVPASTVAMHRAFMKLANKDMVPLDVTVPWTLIRRIKAEHGCTVFEAVAAVLWRCRTRAVISDPEAAAPLSFACNLRKHLGTQDGYYGNCFTQPLVYAAAGTVGSCEIGDLVKLIKCAKEKVLLGASHGESDGESQSQGSTPTMDQIKNLLYNILAVGSWRNLGFDGADFGNGTPSRVVWHMEQVAGPSCIACPPCKGKDGVNVLSLCVKPEHVDAFLAELASMV